MEKLKDAINKANETIIAEFTIIEDIQPDNQSITKLMVHGKAVAESKPHRAARGGLYEKVFNTAKKMISRG